MYSDKRHTSLCRLSLYPQRIEVRPLRSPQDGEELVNTRKLVVPIDHGSNFHVRDILPLPSYVLISSIKAALVYSEPPLQDDRGLAQTEHGSVSSRNHHKRAQMRERMHREDKPRKTSSATKSATSIVMHLNPQVSRRRMRAIGRSQVWNTNRHLNIENIPDSALMVTAVPCAISLPAAAAKPPDTPTPGYSGSPLTP